MKTLYILASLCLSSILFFSCNKDEVPAPVPGYTLMDKSPDEIRNIVSGTWQVQREIQVTAADENFYTDEKKWPGNSGHIIRFLSNDTLNMVSGNNSIVYGYGKAPLTRIPNPLIGNVLDSVNAYLIPNGNKWIMKEIKNDTLVFYDVYPQYITVTYFATRKN